MYELTAERVAEIKAVAQVCGVQTKTAIRWFDTGALKGYRVPGSKVRNVPVSQLNRFMKERGCQPLKVHERENQGLQSWPRHSHGM